MRVEKRINNYGICSYVGLRSPQSEEGVHFKLQKVIKIAQEEGGSQHGLRFVMVPVRIDGFSSAWDFHRYCMAGRTTQKMAKQEPLIFLIFVPGKESMSSHVNPFSRVNMLIFPSRVLSSVI